VDLTSIGLAAPSERKIPQLDTLRAIPASFDAMNLAVTLLSVPLIFDAASAFTGLAGLVLMQKPIRYVGRISYGIYIYHMPVGWAIGHATWLHKLPRFIPHSFALLSATLGPALS